MIDTQNGATLFCHTLNDANGQLFTTGKGGVKAATLGLVVGMISASQGTLEVRDPVVAWVGQHVAHCVVLDCFNRVWHLQRSLRC